MNNFFHFAFNKCKSEKKNKCQMDHHNHNKKACLYIPGYITFFYCIVE